MRGGCSFRTSAGLSRSQAGGFLHRRDTDPPLGACELVIKREAVAVGSVSRSPGLFLELSVLSYLFAAMWRRAHIVVVSPTLVSDAIRDRIVMNDTRSAFYRRLPVARKLWLNLH